MPSNTMAMTTLTISAEETEEVMEVVVKTDMIPNIAQAVVAQEETGLKTMFSGSLRDCKTSTSHQEKEAALAYTPP